MHSCPPSTRACIRAGRTCCTRSSERWGWRAGAQVIDLGCGEGQHALQLASRFGFRVLGVDPVPFHVQQGNDSLAELDAPTRALLRFEVGAAEAIPADDDSVDLIWSREMVVLLEDVDAMLAECRRVLRPGGHILIMGTFSTDLLEPGDAVRLDSVPGFGNSDPGRLEAALPGCGLDVVECVDLGSEWGEFSQEARGVAARRLSHTARLLREPERYIAQFGQDNYDIMLADCYWHAFRMIGKLAGRVYVLRKPSADR